MRTAILTFLLILIAAPAVAQTSDAELRQLVQRAAEAVDKPGNQADREAAARALREAIRALEQERPLKEEPVARKRHRRHRGGNAHTELCIDLGVKAYGKSMYEEAALEKAVEQCNRPVDGNVLSLAYDVYRESLYESTAFEKAVQLGQRGSVIGKSELLEFAFEKYKKSLYGAAALEKAAQWVGPLRRRDESCIRRAYSVHHKTLYPASALDKAVETCGK